MLRESTTWLRLLALAPLVIALTACGKSQADKDAEAKEAAYREKYAKAEALFKERCKTAGVVVKRTVRDVEGIELTKIRQPIPWGGKEYFDPMYPGAAMAGNSTGDRYVWQFLQSEFRYSYAPEQRGALGPPNYPSGYQQLDPTAGYRYVEYFDTKSGRWQRCTAKRDAQSARAFEDLMGCQLIKEPTSKYALDYEDLIDPSDRALWVAGIKLKVIDKNSGEVIAELTKFVWDPGFGVRATGRLPWEHAGSALSTVCPSYPKRPHGSDSRYFIDTILEPKQGE